MWIQTGVTVRKRLSWVVTSVTLTFDLWPWPFAWTSLLSLVITPENFMMIQWWKHSQKGVTDKRTDRRTDGRTDWTIHRAAWSQLKTVRVSVTSLTDFVHICSWYPISQIPQCTGPKSHNTPFCNRNVNTCAHFCYKMVHCGIKDWCIVGYGTRAL